jgi:carboxymethylenebutenolidase
MVTGGLTRRDFMVGGTVAAGYALAAQPVSADAIHTDSDGLIAGEISIPGHDGPVPGYRARPEAGGPAPVVLVVHEIFGLHEYIRDVCRRLAKSGYLGIAPDLYQRQGDVTKMGKVPEIIDGVVSKVPDDQVLADLDATVAWTEDSGEGDTARLGITGFCWGGRFAWVYAAHNATVGAGCAWYGRLAATGPGVLTEIGLGRTYPLDIADRLNAPILGLYAGRDGSIPQETVEQMRTALTEAGDASEIVVYPDSLHGFHGDYRPFYDEAAAKDGWARMLDWFEQYGISPAMSLEKS